MESPNHESAVTNRRSLFLAFNAHREVFFDHASQVFSALLALAFVVTAFLRARHSGRSPNSSLDHDHGHVLEHSMVSRPASQRFARPKKIGRFAPSIAISPSSLPIFIGLQEVRDSRQAALAIRPLSGFKVDVCSNFPPRDDQRETQQIAIASRLQPISAWAEAWKPGAAITPPRGFAFAAYQLSPNQVLLVYALHLKSNRGEIREDMRIREESMRQLLSHMKGDERRPTARIGALTWIVGGDFNTAPDEPRFAREKTVPALMADGFSWAWAGIPFSSRITLLANARYPAACFRPHLLSRRDSSQSLGHSHLTAIERSSRRERDAEAQVGTPRRGVRRICHLPVVLAGRFAKAPSLTLLKKLPRIQNPRGIERILDRAMHLARDIAGRLRPPAFLRQADAVLAR